MISSPFLSRLVRPHMLVALSLPFAVTACSVGVAREVRPGTDTDGGIAVTPDGSPGPGPGPEPGVTPEPGPAPISRGTLTLSIDEVSSSRVTLSWDSVEGAEGVTVYLGSEPSESADGALPVARVVASLDGTATSYTVENLAASTDAFLRVEARVGGEIRWGNTHAHTIGGQRAALDTPLREVHGFGVDMLELVVANGTTRYESGSLSGNLGGAWQGGEWTVERADGSAVGVRSVHRRTIPIGQPDYPVGYGRFGNDDVVELDHHIYLELEERLGDRDVLRVRHAGDAATSLDTLLPFSDRYLVTPLLQVNQVGYNPRASRRWAYVSGHLGDGGPADLGSLPPTADILVESLDPLTARRSEVADLPVTVRSGTDAEALGEVREIDLATVPAQEGVRYRVRIPGVGVSWPTAISEESAFKSFYTVLRGLFHNRWCGDLASTYTEWSRPEDHCTAYFVTGTRYGEGFFSASNSRSDAREVRGGHHDAGDFDIRPYHVMATQYLLRAFAQAPARFTDGQLTIPESGNGIPDVLDEALWSVAAWEALQNPDGTIRAGVESNQHPAGIYFANDDELPYWTFDPEAWHTAYVTGLFAQAARLVAPYDAGRAAELERAARSAYDSPITASAPASYRLFAASELTALTGEARYATDFRDRWNEIDRFGGGAFDNLETAVVIYPGSFTGYAPAMVDFVMGYAGSSSADAGIVAIIRERMGAKADEVANDLLDSPHAHRLGRDPSDAPDWGHTSSTGRHADVLYQALQLGGLSAADAQRYFDAISVAADYALGCNPAGYTYITGLGSFSPMQPLHLDSLAFLKADMPPVPGIPVYGPTRSFPGHRYMAAVGSGYYPAYDSMPPGYRVSDNRTAVNMSEFTVWESQAPFAELFSALVMPSMAPPASWLPGASRHRETLPRQLAD